MPLNESDINYLNHCLQDGNFWGNFWFKFEHFIYKLLGIDEKHYQIQSSLYPSNYKAMAFEILIEHQSLPWSNTRKEIKEFRRKIYTNLSYLKKLGISISTKTENQDFTNITMQLSQQQARKVIFMAVRKYGSYIDKNQLQYSITLC